VGSTKRRAFPEDKNRGRKTTRHKLCIYMACYNPRRQVIHRMIHCSRSSLNVLVLTPLFSISVLLDPFHLEVPCPYILLGTSIIPGGKKIFKRKGI